MTPRERIHTLKEAVALEEAGGYWTQRHVAAVTGYSTAFVRQSDCPRSYQDGNGPKGRERLVYIPADVRAWMRGRLRKAG